MNLSHVEYFVKAAETLSFSRAAEELFVTQQAVSKAIAHLEGELGARLFVRGLTGLELTDTGRLALDRSRALLRDVRLLEECAAQAAPGEPRERIVRLAATETIVGKKRFVTLDSLFAFEQSHPGVRLEVTEASSDTCLSLVESGGADLAIVIGRAGRAGLTSQLLHAAEYVAFCAAGHALTRQERPSVEELARCTFLIPRGESGCRDVMREQLFDAGVPMPSLSQFHFPDCTPAMLIDLVYQSDHVGLIPRRSTDLVDAARGTVPGLPAGLIRLPLSLVEREAEQKAAAPQARAAEAPECAHPSPGRGGDPLLDQLRAFLVDLFARL